MKKAWIALFCCILLITAVSAEGTASKADCTAIVTKEGSCTISITMTLLLRESVEDLMYPLPTSAIDITLNGAAARTRTLEGKRSIDLSGVVNAAGTYTLAISYTLPDVIAGTEEAPVLKLELLSGFAYPIEKLDFTLSLPGKIIADPVFYSNYHLEGVESNMSVQIEENTIAGSFQSALKDQETLSVTLEVAPEDFASAEQEVLGIGIDDLGMAILTGLAALYWLLSMRSAPPKKMRWTKEPSGITAGELGCVLTGRGVDFTMMVLSWAQMGYILIEVDDGGRVLLHRRMDMGNERSDFEIKFFRNLFGKRRVVDGTGHHYARLCRKAAMICPNIRNYYERSTGNPVIFRLLMAAAGCFAGISLASAFTPDTAWQTILSIVLGILAPIASWMIQEGGQGIHTRHRGKLLVAWGLMALWILLGFLGGEALIAIAMALLQFIAGLAAAYGGRRSAMGKQLMAQTLGLRRYMRKLTKGEVVQILRRNPEYFYQMAPYAMALHADKAFAKHFGGVSLSECSYLTTGTDGHMTAREWNQLLREAVYALDATQQRMLLDTLTGK